MTNTESGYQEKTSGQQIERGAAEHLALEHLQTINLPFDGALTPGQGDGGLNGAVVRTQSFRKAPEGRQGARGGTAQPGVELGRLALPDQAGEVLRQRDGLRQFRCLL